METTRAVLVTGASTGFGRKMTERLAREGYFVYAGVRKDTDVLALERIDNVQPLRLDVTHPPQISAAVAAITSAGRGLYGLVNNAGVLTLGPVLHGNDDEFDLAMTVNAYGPYRITKAFAPLIVAQKGRIVTIGSLAGLRGVQNASAYSMSKHAVEGFTDALAQEMRPYGVHVSTVEPGSFNTEIAANAIKRIGVDPRLLEFSNYQGPERVVDAVLDALSATQPKRRYMVAATEAEARNVMHRQIERLVQLNEQHAYSHDRDTLMRMLDEALEGSCRNTAENR